MASLQPPNTAAVELQHLNAAPSTQAEREPLMAEAPPFTNSAPEQPSNAAPDSLIEPHRQSQPGEVGHSLSSDHLSGTNAVVPRPHPEAGQVSPVDSADDSSTSGSGRLNGTPKQPASFKRSTSRVDRLLKDTWTAEVVSCIVAVVALAGLIALLAISQDRPIPHWPQGISINTAISVFTTVLKAGLVMPLSEGISQLKYLWFRETHTLIDIEDYDSASRGPWGSLLFMIKPRKHYLATFGALLIVVAMGIDPFSQQILHFYDCAQYVSESAAAIPRSNNYTNAWIHVFVGENLLTAPMSVAISVGQLAPPQNVSSVLSVQCESGNCTFPADAGVSYMTLSMCSSCTDISESIIDSRTEGSTPWNWTLPAMPSTAFYNATPTARIGYSVDLMVQIAALGTDNALLMFESLMFSCDGVEDMAACSSGINVKPFATRCSLFPCVKTYGANITKFVLDEKLLSSIPLTWTPGTQDQGYFALTSDSTMKNGTGQDCSPSKQPTESNTVGLSENYTLAYDDGVNATYWTSVDCFWYVEPLTVQALAGGLNSFAGQTLSDAYGDIFQAFGDLFLVGLYHNATANLSTFSEYVDGLANAMSAEMRKSGTGDAALGQVMTNQTCIRVQWAWLSLPIALVLLTILFLALMIWASFTWAWHGLWKSSSSLALLFATVESETLLQDSTSDKRSQFCKTAEEMQVRFEQTDHGWGFIERN